MALAILCIFLVKVIEYIVLLYHIADDDDDGRQSELKFSPNDKKINYAVFCLFV